MDLDGAVRTGGRSDRNWRRDGRKLYDLFQINAIFYKVPTDFSDDMFRILAERTHVLAERDKAMEEGY